jgi:ABC-type dipeptide/oligopeptide/nickel transport system permease subunit
MTYEQQNVTSRQHMIFLSLPLPLTVLIPEFTPGETVFKLVSAISIVRSPSTARGLRQLLSL